jgi:hypothetical protein
MRAGVVVVFFDKVGFLMQIDSHEKMLRDFLLSSDAVHRDCLSSVRDGV